MKKYMKIFITEKAQGLTEYVLILAFIAGIAFAMFGGNGSLKGTLVNTFTRTVNIIAGLLDENYGYVTASKNYSEYFADWKDKSSEYLGGISSVERLKADQEGLALIASYFLGATQGEVAELMGKYSNSYNSAPDWLKENLDSSRMGPDENGWSQIMVPLSYWNSDIDGEFNAKEGTGYIWTESGNNIFLIKDMAGDVPVDATSKNNIKFKDDNNNNQTRTGTQDRIFYSDGMIGSDSSNRAVTLQVHYNGDTVDQVRVQAVTGVLKQNKKIEGKYDLSPGNSALHGKSTAVDGLDLTVTGSSSDYKYKVN